MIRNYDYHFTNKVALEINKRENLVLAGTSMKFRLDSYDKSSSSLLLSLQLLSNVPIFNTKFSDTVGFSF
jgi:hypothetical protein